VSDGGHVQSAVEPTRSQGNSSTRSSAPPNAPWRELHVDEDAGGYVTVYYSDDLSPLPVRWVTKPGDNKSDPNLETGTYGLFSTCGRGLRSGVVNRGYPHLFFVTSRREGRVLAGYYRVRWYAAGVFGLGNDLCLAADRVRFIASPPPLVAVDRQCGTDLAHPFRSMRLLSPEECRRLLRVLERRPDATAAYLAEIDRLERFNLKHGGYRYVGWKQVEKFSWSYAAKYLQPGGPAPTPRVLNTSPSGSWTCVACEKHTVNVALLKRCPECGAVGTLRPM